MSKIKTRELIKLYFILIYFNIWQKENITIKQKKYQ